MQEVQSQLAAIQIGNQFFQGGQGAGQGATYSSFAAILVDNLISIGGVVFVFLIIWAGYQIILGAGSGNPQKIDKGKETLKWTIVGFIVLFSSWWFIKILGLATGLQFT